MMDKLKNINFVSLALALGPVLMVVAFAIANKRMCDSLKEVHEVVEKITKNADERHNIILDIRLRAVKAAKAIETCALHFNENLAKIKEGQSEILRKQEELFTAIQVRKLDRLMSERKDKWIHSEMKFDWSAK